MTNRYFPRGSTPPPSTYHATVLGVHLIQFIGVEGDPRRTSYHLTSDSGEPGSWKLWVPVDPSGEEPA